MISVHKLKSSRLTIKLLFLPKNMILAIWHPRLLFSIIESSNDIGNTHNVLFIVSR